MRTKTPVRRRQPGIRHDHEGRAGAGDEVSAEAAQQI